jgi:diguanylate cyclase (GGDEF)-like protein
VRVRARRSIAFRLWLRLSVVALVTTSVALSLFVWLTVEESLHNAQDQVAGSIGAVVTATSRMATTGSSPTPAEVNAAFAMGIASIEAIGADGRVMVSHGAFESTRAARSLSPEQLDLIATNQVLTRHVKLSSADYSETSIGPLRLLTGGKYGEEYVYAVNAFAPGAPGAYRFVAAYPDLAEQAQTLLLRSAGLALAIIGGLVLGMWALVDRLIARPLRTYSDLAMRMAAGEPLRMPLLARDELGQLGQAINGMADALGHQATVDPLTGLCNLRHLTSRLETLLEYEGATNRPLALIVCDMDRFKSINDTYGHAAGDRVLKAVADAMLTWADGKYTCWRLGGDEFAIALPDTEGETAVREARRLEMAIRDLRVSGFGHHLRVSASLGIAAFPDDGDNVAALLVAADRRMYEIKALRNKKALASAPAA